MMDFICPLSLHHTTSSTSKHPQPHCTAQLSTKAGSTNNPQKTISPPAKLIPTPSNKVTGPNGQDSNHMVTPNTLHTILHDIHSCTVQNQCSWDWSALSYTHPCTILPSIIQEPHVLVAPKSPHHEVHV